MPNHSDHHEPILSGGEYKGWVINFHPSNDRLINLTTEEKNFTPVFYPNFSFKSIPKHVVIC